MTNAARLRARIIDIALIAMMILPFVGCMVLKVLFTPEADGISITGPLIYLTIPMPLQPLYISESTVVSAAVVIAITALCLYLTHGIKEIPDSKRQIVAEFIVEKTSSFVNENMGARFAGFAPFVAAIMALSALSSMASLLGLYSPTSDINIVAGWAIIVFILITHFKLRGGLGNYLKSFGDPIPIFYPFNVVSEIATPVSMTFRHYGNILSGAVISTLIAALFSKLSNLFLSLFSSSTFVTSIPFLRIGIPAVLSLYFDVFSSILQAFIFAMLTMLNVANGYPEEAVAKRQEKRAAKAARKHGTNA
jgi:F-type H+-transporting ATPase subunit a